MLSIQQAHKRYRQQAAWTQNLRQHLASKFELGDEAKILEVGSGTAAVLGEFAGQGRIFGIDIDSEAIELGQQILPVQNALQGDGHWLPFPAASFDLCYCHFLLMWVDTPRQVLNEMSRVVKSGGWLAAFAEPDYAGRIDYPPELEGLGRIQAQALASQGADPRLGRQLAGLFAQLQLEESEVGILGLQRPLLTPTGQEEEQTMWKADLAGLASAKQIAAWEEAENRAVDMAMRINFVPTFFALGRKV